MPPQSLSTPPGSRQPPQVSEGVRNVSGESGDPGETDDCIPSAPSFAQVRCQDSVCDHSQLKQTYCAEELFS